MASTVLFTLGSGASATAVTLGSVLTVGGALMSAVGAAKSYDAQAQSAQYNANLQRQEASAEEARRRKAADRQMGTIRANRAKSGVTGEGTPLLVLAESAEQAEIDALSARWSGETSANLYEQQAKSARKAKPYAVGSSLLTGAANIGRSIQ